MPSKSSGGKPPKRVHNRFDRTLKRIAERTPADLLAWLADILGWPATTLVQASLSKELVSSEQEVDLLWLVETDGEQELLHWEFQLQDETRMGLRLAGYALQLIERDKRPVHTVIMQLRRQNSVLESPFVIGTKRREYLRYEFDAVRLWEVDPDTVLKKQAPYLWPLAAMMANMTPQRVLAVAEQIVAAVPPGEDRKELVGMLVVLAGVQFKDAEIATALRENPMIDDIWEESETAQAQRARGHAEGLVEGRAELARVALEARFGELSQEVLAALIEAPDSTLTQLIAALVNRPNMAPTEVRQRLGLKPA
jgi:predicted transposase YdaD